jgi:glycosyltransferase involved in cell wall biosynthesis
MRIFVAVRHSLDPTFYYGGLWSGNFYPALRQLGHEIVESEIDLQAASRFMDIAGGFTPQELEVRSQITERIIGELKQAHSEKPVDFFLSYFYNSHFDPDGFREIERLGIPSVNFYCNSIYQFALVSEIASAVDFSWHAEKEARDLYLGVNANPIWVQMGADPEVYRPVETPFRTPAACFVGQRYSDRDRWMAELVRAEVPVVIYGSGWGSNGTAKQNGTPATANPSEYLGRKSAQPQTLQSYLEVAVQNLRTLGPVAGTARLWHQTQYRRETHALVSVFAPFAKGPVPFEEICNIFSSHEVILNFSNVWADGRPGSRLIPHVRLRDFEAPMCRTCYLTGHTDEIADFYELGKEIDTYRTPEELIDKASYYLSHPAEAERLREAGYRRAKRDHTWVRRFNELFEKTGLAGAR